MCSIRRTALVVLMLALAGCESAKVTRQEGLAAYDRRDYALSAVKFQKLADENPGDWQAQWYLGRIALAQADVNSARMHLEVAYTLRGKGEPLNPETADIVDDLAAALLLQGDRARCISLCDEAIRNFGKPYDYMRKADLLVKMGDADAAVTTYLQAAKVGNYTDSTPYQRVADIFDQAGAREKAIDALRVACFIDPRNPDIQQHIRKLGEIPGPTFARPPVQ